MSFDNSKHWPEVEPIVKKNPVFDENTPAEATVRDFVLRIGQLKYDLRLSQTTVRTLEVMVAAELAIIVLLAVMICAA